MPTDSIFDQFNKKRHGFQVSSKNDTVKLRMSNPVVKVTLNSETRRKLGLA